MKTKTEHALLWSGGVATAAFLIWWLLNRGPVVAPVVQNAGSAPPNAYNLNFQVPAGFGTPPAATGYVPTFGFIQLAGQFF